VVVAFAAQPKGVGQHGGVAWRRKWPRARPSASLCAVASLGISDLLSLYVPERIRLAQAIWDSIAEVPERVEVTDAEREELDRRLESYYRDPTAGSSWSEVKARIRGQR
jgi:putative addiction module component (TIGR02574 family)